MRNKTILFIVAALAFTMVSCNTKKSGNDTTAIDNIRLAFNAAYNSKNLQSLDSLIDVNAIWSVPQAPAITGKDGIISIYSNLFTNGNSSLEIKAGDIQINGDWAMLTADYSRTDTVKTDTASTAQNVTGHCILAFKKQEDGSWKIARDIWN